jgi:hypothetical protein
VYKSVPIFDMETNKSYVSLGIGSGNLRTSGCPEDDRFKGDEHIQKLAMLGNFLEDFAGFTEEMNSHTQIGEALGFGHDLAEGFFQCW